MKSVYKYPLTAQTNKLRLPKGAEILSAGWQAPEVVIWALIDTEQTEAEERHIEVAGTGWPLPVGEDKTVEFKFITTVQMNDTAIMRLVWHIFEVVHKQTDNGDKPELPGSEKGI